VNALSTLKDDDDASVGSGLYSSEEDINNGNDRLKTVQGNGTNVSSIGYGDYHPPQGGGEPSVRRGGGGYFASSPLKKGGGGTFPPFGGQYPHPTSRYGTPKKNHVTSKYGAPKYGTSKYGTLKSGTSKNKSFSQRSKRAKDVLKALWKKCVCHGKKHRRWMMFFAVVIMVILYLVSMCYAKISRGARDCFIDVCEKAAAASTTACTHVVTIETSVIIFTATAAVVVAVLGVLIGCYYFKSLEKYIQSKSQP
ncbi:hypothetical protein, conserved in P.knowlesi, partial [Plasmodium knowlesi strain H]